MTLGDRVVVMKDGLVQQVGDPLTLYNTPANLFVAGFIGSPAMNFANVTVVGGEGGLWVETKGLKLRLPGPLASRAAPLTGKKATLGIRPEDLRVANGADPVEYCMESEVEVVERLGSETLLDTARGQRNGGRLGRAAGRRARARQGASRGHARAHASLRRRTEKAV